MNHLTLISPYTLWINLCPTIPYVCISSTENGWYFQGFLPFVVQYTRTYCHEHKHVYMCESHTYHQFYVCNKVEGTQLHTLVLWKSAVLFEQGTYIRRCITSDKGYLIASTSAPAPTLPQQWALPLSLCLPTTRHHMASDLSLPIMLILLYHFLLPWENKC